MAFYTIYPREISTVIFQKRAKIIDIREKEKFYAYHYNGAINVPYDESDCWWSRFPKNRVLILYCEYGSSSLFAARKLSKMGCEVYTVIGGAKAMREYFSN